MPRPLSNKASEPPAMVVAEPVLGSYAHASFNAAMLRSLSLAFPDHRMTFIGLRSHQDAVDEVLCLSGLGTAATFERQTVSVPLRSHPTRRLLVASAFGIAAQLLRARPRIVCLLSSPPPLLSVVTALTALRAGGMRTGIVCHGSLASVLGSSRALRRFQSLMSKLDRAGRVTLLTFNERSLTTLREWGWRGVSPRTAVVAMPHLSAEAETREPPPNVGEKGPVFAWLGRTSKGDFAWYVQIADRSRQAGRRCSFRVVGPISGSHLDLDLRAIEGMKEQRWLTAQEYASGLAESHYAVLPVSGDACIVGASAAILDAIVAERPIVGLRNPYFEDLFERFGDIGYLCQSVNEMELRMNEIMDRFPVERFKSQVERLRRARLEFSPARIVRDLRIALAEQPRHGGERAGSRLGG